MTPIPSRSRSPPRGVSCALAEGSVQDHINQPSPGDNNTLHIAENTGNIAATSRDFSMDATTNKDGIDPAAVVMLARALRRAAPILDLPEDDAAEFTQLATRLETEAATGSPDPGRLQRWGSSIVGILNSPVVSGALGKRARRLHLVDLRRALPGEPLPDVHAVDRDPGQDVHRALLVGDQLAQRGAVPVSEPCSSRSGTVSPEWWGTGRATQAGRKNRGSTPASATVNVFSVAPPG